MDSNRSVNKQSNDPVIAFRLPREYAERLDRLAAHTHRSRGVYVREAVRKMLPLFESRLWDQVVRDYNDDFDQAFSALMAQVAMTPDQDFPNETSEGEQA